MDGHRKSVTIPRDEAIAALHTGGHFYTWLVLTGEAGLSTARAVDLVSRCLAGSLGVSHAG